MKKILKGLGVALLVVALIAGATYAFVPPVREGVKNMVSRKDTEPTAATTEPTAATTEPTAATTEPTAATTEPTTATTEATTATTEPTEPTELEAPYSFQEFAELAITTEWEWNIPYEGAVIFDLREDDFLVENEESQKQEEYLRLRVTDNGRMSVYQEGWERPEAGDREAGKLQQVTLCSCKEHKASWNPKMGMFSWYVAEGNQALCSSCWSFQWGFPTEVSLNYQARQAIRAAACYWYTTNEQGEPEVVFGLRVCEGEKKTTGSTGSTGNGSTGTGSNGNGSNEPKPTEPQPTEPQPTEPKPTEPQPTEPKPTEPQEPQLAPETKKCIVKMRFEGSGCDLPSAVKVLCPSSTVVEMGKTFQAPALATTVVQANGGTYRFQRWSVSSVKVTGDVTITGYWSYEKANEPSHSDQPTEEPTEPTTGDTNPVAPDQDDLNDGVVWGDYDAGANNPVHSEQPEEPTEPTEPGSGSGSGPSLAPPPQ